METTFIEYEVDGAVATITLNRPEAANAQTLPMLDDLDEAWRMAADDDSVRVIILQANGKHFSSGHDLKGVGDDGPVVANPDAPAKFTLQNIYEIEARRFLEYSLRWRNVPKPSICAVQASTLKIMWSNVARSVRCPMSNGWSSWASSRSRHRSSSRAVVQRS